MDGSTYLNLTAWIRRILAHEVVGSGENVVRFLDVTPTGDYGHGAGLRATIESLWSHAKPVIVLGLPSTLDRAALRPASNDQHLMALFQWPGAAYMQYGFTRDQLVATARQVIEGARTLLPPGLLPTVGDVLRLTSEIRHWLENRLRNTEGALNDFESARRGEIQLHRTHLESVAAISEEHRAMLDRLWALEVPGGRFAPRTGGLGPMKTAVAEFETRWQALEAARAALRASGTEGWEELLAEAVTEFKRVRDALSAATMATLELDNELMAWEAN